VLRLFRLLLSNNTHSNHNTAEIITEQTTDEAAKITQSMYRLRNKGEFRDQIAGGYLRGTTYLWTPLFGMIPVVTLFVVCAGAVVQTVNKN